LKPRKKKVNLAPWPANPSAGQVRIQPVNYSPSQHFFEEIMVKISDPAAKGRCELLAPAGSLEKLRTVIHYGADAVYLGGRDFSLRAHATNFSAEELAVAVAFAHARNVRVYVTVNVFAHNRDLAGVADYLAWLAGIGADGVIIADPGVLRLAKQAAPALPIHLSTQANVTNGQSALFWQEQGVSRLNLARELTLAEIGEIRQTCTAGIEVFVHGALCISYSGRCLLSLYFTGRDANQGDCAHPCRYGYRLQEEKRPGQFFPVEEDGRGTYIFSSKDLCLINRLPELVAAGVDAIKIEGRMKGISYAGAIVRIYRAALDYVRAALADNPGTLPAMPPLFMAEILKLGTRGYTENFLHGPPAAGDMCYAGAVVGQSYAPAGIVLAAGERPLIEVRNRIRPGERLEYMEQGLQNSAFTVTAVTAEDGRPLAQADSGSRARLTTDPVLTSWQPYGLLRRGQG
jgi:putative protease